MAPLASPLFPSARARTIWRWVILLGILAVNVAAYSPEWWIGKDGALYMNLARNLARGEGYTLCGMPHTHVPPGYPWFLAGLMKLGITGFAGINAVMAMLGLLNVWLAYQLLKQLVHKDWAVVLTAVSALSLEWVQRSGETLSDMPFMLLVQCAMVLYLRGLGGRTDRRGWEVASLLLAVTPWLRIAGVPMGLGAAAGLVVFGGKVPRLRAVLNALVVFGGMAASMLFFAWYHKLYHDPTSSTEAGRIGRFLAGQIGVLANFSSINGHLCRLYISQRMPVLLCVILMTVPVLVAMGVRLRKGERLTPLAILAYVLVLCLITKEPRTRYLLPVAPLLVLYLIEGYAWLIGTFGRKGRMSTGAVLTALCVILVAMNAPRVGRLIHEKHRADFRSTQQGGVWKYAGPAVDYLRAHNDGGCLLAPEAIAYLADMPAPSVSLALLATNPDDHELARLLNYWHIHYVVLETKSDPRQVFYRALRDYLNQHGTLVFSHPQAVVYQVNPPPATSSSSLPAGKP